MRGDRKEENEEGSPSHGDAKGEKPFLIEGRKRRIPSGEKNKEVKEKRGGCPL